MSRYNIARKFNIGLYLLYTIIGIGTVATHFGKEAIFPLLIVLYDLLVLFTLLRGSPAAKFLVASEMAVSICFLLASIILAELAPLSPLVFFYLALTNFGIGLRSGILLFLAFVYGYNLFWLVPKLNDQQGS